MANFKVGDRILYDKRYLYFITEIKNKSYRYEIEYFFDNERKTHLQNTINIFDLFCSQKKAIKVNKNIAKVLYANNSK